MPKQQSTQAKNVQSCNRRGNTHPGSDKKSSEKYTSKTICCGTAIYSLKIIRHLREGNQSFDLSPQILKLSITLSFIYFSTLDLKGTQYKLLWGISGPNPNNGIYNFTSQAMNFKTKFQNLAELISLTAKIKCIPHWSTDYH